MPKPVAAEGAPTVKPTIKKETVRIDVPANVPKPVPQATVKIQAAPVPSRIPDAPVRTVPTLVTTTTATRPVAGDADEPAAQDSTLTLVAGGVLLFAAASLGMQVWTYLTN